MIEEDLIIYLLKECGGLHPFHISRLIALLDMEYLKEHGKKLTSFDYQKTEYGFHSDKLSNILKELPVEKIEAKPYGYLVLKEDLPAKLPEDVLEKMNSILDDVCELNDLELNSKILNSPLYEKL